MNQDCCGGLGRTTSGVLVGNADLRNLGTLMVVLVAVGSTADLLNLGDLVVGCTNLLILDDLGCGGGRGGGGAVFDFVFDVVVVTFRDDILFVVIFFCNDWIRCSC